MLIRVQLRLLCPTQEDASTVASAIQQKLTTKPLRVTHGNATAVRIRGQWQVRCDVAFQLRVDADDVYADVQAKWGSGSLKNKILNGSNITLHVCTHDDGEPGPWQSCRSIEYLIATKAA